MDFETKSGIKIHVPTGTPLQDWLDAKMAVSILLDPPIREEPKVRKPYTYQSRRTEAIKRRTKNWRSQKKLK